MRRMGDDGIPTMELSAVGHCEADDLSTSRDAADDDDGPASGRERNAAEDSTVASGQRQSTAVAIVNDAHVVALNSVPTGHSLLAVADLDDGDVSSGYAKKLSYHAKRPEDH